MEGDARHIQDVDLLPLEECPGATQVDSLAQEDVEEMPVDVAASERSTEIPYSPQGDVWLGVPNLCQTDHENQGMGLLFTG